ncbi:MAG: glycosyltransferase family 4 protein, partial [candidate division Zixibacteria bacterium]|nr:glycosyltransferase family 4 protein [candidate division Zixibacteria bacterium]
LYRILTPKIFGTHYWFTFLSFPKIFRLADRYDVVHTTTYNAALPAWLAAKLKGKRVIITVLQAWGALWRTFKGMNWLSARLHQLFEKFVITLPFDDYICISEHTKNSVMTLGLKSERLRVIHCGVDYELFDPTRYDHLKVKKELGLSHRFVYMSYGRAGISKGIEYLIEAVPLISRKIPNSKLLLILASDPKHRYEYIIRLIEKLRSNEDIVLKNQLSREGLVRHIAASDCVVVPSLTEGFGLIAAETCAMNKPVVCSKAGALPEVVSGKYVLVNPESPEEIAEGVERIYRDEVKETERKYFYWEECINKYLQTYRGLSEHTEPDILMDHKEVSGEDELQVLEVGHEIMDKAQVSS